MNRKFLSLIPLLIILPVAGYYLWWALFFFPDDYEITRQEALQTDKTEAPSRVIDISLIDRIDQAQLVGDFSQKRIGHITKLLKKKKHNIKEDSYITARRRDLVHRFGTGWPGIWIDERSALVLPDRNSISISCTLPDGAMLELSAISPLSRGRLSVEILNGNKLLKETAYTLDRHDQQYTIADQKMLRNNRGFEKAKADPGWRDYSIDLASYSGRRVTVRFTFHGTDGCAFIANPRIFKLAEKRRYNVIYLIFDGVATRYYSFYNKNSNLTPFMKEVADREYIIFDNMYTLGNKTRISTAGLFTSQIPTITRHGINRNYIPEKEKELFYNYIRKKRFASLPDIFRKQGYISEQYGNSGFTVHLLSTGIDYGFDSSYEFSYNPYDSYGISHRLFDFLRKNRNREFFLYLHYNTPHKPFYAPINYFVEGFVNSPLEAKWRPDFLGCIRYTDSVFKNIYTALKTNNLLENTIIVVATDHGAGYDMENFDRGFQFNDYTRLAYMMFIPKSLEEKQSISTSTKRVGTYLSSINIAPTLLDLTGISGDYPFAGKSFTGVLNGSYKNNFFDREIWCYGRKTISLLTNDYYKYILTFTDTRRYVDRKYIFFGLEQMIPMEQLYYLKDDPWEKRNLIFEEKETLQGFRDLFYQRDVLHPERTILSFLPVSKKEKSVSLEIETSSPIIINELYTDTIGEKQIPFTRTDSGNSHRYSFTLGTEPVYFLFETDNDRIPVSITIKENGLPIDAGRIFATAMNLNIYGNPVVLDTTADFHVLNEITLPSYTYLPKEGSFIVNVLRMDLHRLIDLVKYDDKGITAGMKATLKSWGYIQ